MRSPLSVSLSSLCGTCLSCYLFCLHCLWCCMACLQDLQIGSSLGLLALHFKMFSNCVFEPGLPHHFPDVLFLKSNLIYVGHSQSVICASAPSPLYNCSLFMFLAYIQRILFFFSSILIRSLRFLLGLHTYLVLKSITISF